MDPSFQQALEILKWPVILGGGIGSGLLVLRLFRANKESQTRIQRIQDEERAQCERMTRARGDKPLSLIKG